MTEKWDPFEQTLLTFGRDNLTRVWPEAIDNVNIPELSKRFLIEVGLPNAPVLLCEFDLDAPIIPTIEEYAASLGIQFVCAQRLRRIGWDGGVQLCLNEGEESGSIIAIDIKEEHPSRFVNSSVEQLGGFLALYVDDYCRYRNLPEEELNSRAYELDAKLRSLDTPAFASGDNWWPCITQQMKGGML